MASTPTTGRSSIGFASPVTEKNPVNKCEMKAWIRVDGKSLVPLTNYTGLRQEVIVTS